MQGSFEKLLWLYVCVWVGVAQHMCGFRTTCACAIVYKEDDDYYTMIIIRSDSDYVKGFVKDEKKWNKTDFMLLLPDNWPSGIKHFQYLQYVF